MTAAPATAQLYQFTFFGTVTGQSSNITPGNPLEGLLPGMATVYSFTLDAGVAPSFEDATGRLWFDPEVFGAMSFQSAALSFSRTPEQTEGGFGIFDNDTANFPGMFEDSFVIAMQTFGAPIDFFSFQLQSITSSPDDFTEGLGIPAAIDVGGATIAQYGVSSGAAFRLIQLQSIQIRAIPSPGAMALLAVGGLGAIRRKR